jgi:hypothetical protein
MAHIQDASPSAIAPWHINLFIVGIYANALLLAVAIFFLKQILEAVKRPQRGQLGTQQSQQTEHEGWQPERSLSDRAINKPSGLVPLGGWTGGTGGSKRHIQ